MPKENQAAKATSEKNRRQPKLKPVGAADLANQSLTLDHQLEGLIQARDDGAVEAQSTRLGHPHTLTAQRQNLASQIGRVQGNQHLQQVVAGMGVIQRSPLSDELEQLGQGKSPLEIFALVSRQKFKNGAKDEAERKALTTTIGRLLNKPNDVWVAKKILAGQLGMSAGISAKDNKKLKKDIPSQPIEVYFFPGATDERALVVAGVHGSERQGIRVAQMLIDDVLKDNTPHYTTIVVPALFPDHAHKNWGDEGIRQGSTQTNRNFPDLDQEVADYKDGQALDAEGNPILAKPIKKEAPKAVLAENVLLMELIDRFSPTRIISIHGTHSPSSAGVFADPHFLSPAKQKAIDALATLFGTLWGMMKEVMTGAEVDVAAQINETKTFLTDTMQKIDAARTQNDIDLAIASAYAIAKKTETAGELKTRFKSKKKQQSPAVAGNKLYQGSGNENAVWREDVEKTKEGIFRAKPVEERAKKGVSLGLYGPAKGISVFTVEPAVNRDLDYYDQSNRNKDAGVSKAQREMELKAYADVVATVLLGPDQGAEALGKHRPSTPEE